MTRTGHRHVLLLGLAAAVILISQVARAQDVDPALVEFSSRVWQYVDLHRRLEGPLPPLAVSRDPAVVRNAMDALARALRVARPGVAQGNIFTPRVAFLFRERIAMSVDPWLLAQMIEENEEDMPRHLPALGVNSSFPKGVPFGFVPPSLLRALPPLPEELQYRFVRRTLVLWDHHANLIVDFLPGALAPTT
jgi:hypothetical protein